jgi:hypothetical protein
VLASWPSWLPPPILTAPNPLSAVQLPARPSVIISKEVREAETKEENIVRRDTVAKVNWLYDQLLPARDHMGTGIDQAWADEKARKKQRS